MPSIQTPRLNTQDMASVVRELRQTLTSGVQALNSSLVVGDTLQVYQPYTAASPLVVPTDWTYVGDAGAPAFQNSWANFDGGASWQRASFKKDAFGFVHIRGHIKSGTVPATIFTLPSGYRPPLNEQFSAMSNNLWGLVNVNSDGTVTFNTGTSTPPFASIAGIAFQVADTQPYVPSCFPITAGAWPFNYPPTLVVAQCTDVSNAASPSNLATALTDWTTSTQSDGSTVITIRNIPGLLPSKNYAVTVVAF